LAQSLRKDDPQRAIAVGREFLRDNPGNWGLVAAVGDALRASGKAPEAMAIYDAFIAAPGRKKLDVASAWAAVAEIRLAASQPDEAIKPLESGLAAAVAAEGVNPNDRQMRDSLCLQLGKTYAKLGRFDQAIKVLETASPQNFSAVGAAVQEALIAAYRQAGQYDKAMAAVEKNLADAQSRNSGNVPNPWLPVKVAILLDQKKFAAAMQFVRSFKPDSAQAQPPTVRRLGWTLMMQQVQEALLAAGPTTRPAEDK
jgi:tetratricopeptide (TPR) repeat protein